jgi:hypothetical protein
VHSHPLLKVIVCKDCKFLMEEKMHVKVWILIMPMHSPKLLQIGYKMLKYIISFIDMYVSSYLGLLS